MDPFDRDIAELLSDRAADLAGNFLPLDRAGAILALGNHFVEGDEVVGERVEIHSLARGRRGPFRVAEVARGEPVEATERTVRTLDGVDGDHPASLADEGSGFVAGEGEIRGRNVHRTSLVPRGGVERLCPLRIAWNA